MKYSFQLAAVVTKRRGGNPVIMFVFRVIVPEMGTANGYQVGIEPLPDVRETVEKVQAILPDKIQKLFPNSKPSIPIKGATGAAYFNMICTLFVEFDGHWKKAVKHCEEVQAKVKAACAGGPLDFWDTPVEVR